MADHGFRSSIANKDVKTCSDLDTIVNSKYSNLKGSIASSGQITTSGNYATVSIYHGLGYIPIIRGLSSSGGDWFANMPNFFANAHVDEGAYCYADANYAYIKFHYFQNDFGGEGTFYWKIFIFLDKGKL